MNGRMGGKQGFMALKLDVSKAYDMMEWDFLKGIMKKMGFASKWIQLAMTFVITVSYSILVNGQSQGLIHPTRGLRQGDPLSPYFFYSMCGRIK